MKEIVVIISADDCQTYSIIVNKNKFITKAFCHYSLYC